MPISVRIDPTARILNIDVEGMLTTADMVAALDEADIRVGGRPGFSVLSDHRRIGAPATPAQVAAVLDRLGRQGSPFRGSRWAIVVAGSASYGMMRLLSAHAEHIPLTVRVFWDEAEARRWLEHAAGDATGPDSDPDP